MRVTLPSNLANQWFFGARISILVGSFLCLLCFLTFAATKAPMFVYLSALIGFGGWSVIISIFCLILGFCHRLWETPFQRAIRYLQAEGFNAVSHCGKGPFILIMDDNNREWAFRGPPEKLGAVKSLLTTIKGLYYHIR